VSYVALSYCWGADQKHKLTRAGLRSWYREIPYEELLQTIKDAVKVTMDLDQQYLWIDDLCIIQDDNDDKAREIVRMGDIYEQAYVTIIAARSSNAQHGFLHSRFIPGERGYQIPYMCKDGRLGSVILWRGREADTSEPTDERAWCLQESVLSRRVLEYGTHNLRWHCTLTRVDEDDDRARYARETAPYPLCDGWLEYSETVPLTGPTYMRRIDWTALNDVGQFIKAWKGLVSSYTTRQMGCLDDKLLAVSGIARKMNQLTGNTYMAGLWKEALPELLLWHPEKLPHGKVNPARIPTYVAPSWSWASFVGEIGFLYVGASPAENVTMELLGVDIVNEIEQDEFSAIKLGRTRMKSLTLWVQVRRHEFGSELWHTALDKKVDGWLTWDLAEDDIWQDFGAGAHLLLVCVLVNESLILRRQADGRTYSRVGIFTSGLYASLVEWNEREVVIE